MSLNQISAPKFPFDPTWKQKTKKTWIYRNRDSERNFEYYTLIINLNNRTIHHFYRPLRGLFLM